jgi:formamidopyrimidine-DNA glycosylase
MAKINPSTPAGSLTKGQLKNLHESIIAVLNKGIELGGTSQKDFVQADGSKGSMQNHLMVYRRTGQPCHNCHTAIERMVIAGRGTHYCPQCQRS